MCYVLLSFIILWWHKPRMVLEPTASIGNWIRLPCAYMYVSSRISGQTRHSAWKHMSMRLMVLQYHHPRDVRWYLVPAWARHRAASHLVSFRAGRLLRGWWSFNIQWHPRRLLWTTADIARCYRGSPQRIWSHRVFDESQGMGGGRSCTVVWPCAIILQ